MKSNTGVLFEVIGQENGKDVWKDTKTGLTWYPALKEARQWKDAKAACEKLGLRLPTLDEFKIAEVNGIRSVIADFKGRFFWSTPVLDFVYAMGFNGDTGFTYSGIRSIENSVRCVR